MSAQELEEHATELAKACIDQVAKQVLGN